MAVAADSREPLRRVWASPAGLAGWLAPVNHKQVGIRYISTSFAFFLVGGILALFMRTQLAVPENDFLGPQTYNQLFTMHGTTMMFLFAVPMAEGFATYMVPLMIGARDLAFPRLNAFGYWCFLLGGLFLYGGFLADTVPEAGWFAYVPLSGPAFSEGKGMDLWLLGITFVEISGLVAGTELLVSILKFRAPGMSLNRMPIFVWAVLAISVAIVFGFPPLVIGSLMLEADRSLGTEFFNTDAGGSALLWQHLFWIFGHPEVYIQFLPAAGLISMVIPTFARRPIVGYVFVVFAIFVTALFSFGLWVHHMYATGLPSLALFFFTASSLTIAIPSGIQVFAWLATLWGSRPRFTTSLLFALATIVTFVIGGITGVMVGLVPLDLQVHDTFFVVAHFHYVLIGGVVFPIFSALYYWFPKISGRLLDERLGQLSFWLIFIGFHVTFFPMHFLGLDGMPRRVYTYETGLGLELWNLVATIGAFTIGAGVLLFLWNVAFAGRAGRVAGDNPWEAGTLEWSIPSPPPPYNFETNPVIGSAYPVWYPEPAGDHPALLGPPHFEARETLATTPLDARPAAIVRLPNTSYLPFLLAVAVGTVVLGALFSLLPLIAAGFVLVIGLVAQWVWGDVVVQAARSGRVGPSGLPLDLPRRESHNWWGVLTFVLIFGSMLGALVGSYIYLLSGVPAWPPEGFPDPEPLLPALGAGAMVLGAAAVAATSRWFWHARVPGSLGLALSVVLGVAFGALLLTDQVGVEFSWDEHAYASLYFVLGWFALIIAAAAVLMSAFALVRCVTAREAEQRLSLEAVSLFWYFAALTAVVSVGVVYAGPYVW